MPEERDEVEQRYRRRLRRKRKQRRRRAKAVAVLPSLFTLGNLIAGFAAIHFAAKPTTAEFGPRNWSTLTVAGLLIFVGMFFDAIDGYVARLTRTTSDLGAQLDSLADIVTFGVAPAYMTLQLVSKYYLAVENYYIISPTRDDVFARVIWAIAAVYVSCTALRLARFNVETGSALIEDHRMFRGLPSPGAAGCVASLILLHQHFVEPTGFPWAARVTGLGMAFILLLCALAMVSRLPYAHVINMYVRGHAKFSYIVRLAIILVFAIFFPTLAFAIAFTAYALSAPARALLRVWSRQRRTPAPAHAAPGAS